MKLTPTLRLLATTALLLVGTALVWWLVGFLLGKGILDEAGGLEPFRRAYGYEERALLQLLAFALVAPLARAIAGSASASARWMAVGAVALGAALLFGEKGGGHVGFALFVLGAVAVAESEGRAGLVAALAGAILTAFAFAIDLNLGTGQKIVVVGLRAVFFYLPLLLGPAWLERWLGSI